MNHPRRFGAIATYQRVQEVAAQLAPLVRLVPTRSVSGRLSWKIPGIVLREDTATSCFYRDRVPPAVHQLITSALSGECNFPDVGRVATAIRKVAR